MESVTIDLHAALVRVDPVVITFENLLYMKSSESRMHCLMSLGSVGLA